MRYCITMERTQRIAVWFEADNRDDAIHKGERILAEHQNVESGFDGGDVEYDFAIDDDEDGCVLPWG